MAQDQPTHDLRGILVPDIHLLGCTMAATTEAGPRAGIPEPQQRTALVLEATGDLDSAPTDKQIATIRAGSVGDGSWGWRENGTGSYRRHDPPTAISEWEFIHRSTTNTYRYGHAVRLASGLTIVAYTYNTYGVSVDVQGATGTWTDHALVVTAGATRGTLCVLPSGRIICLYLAYVAAAVTQLGMSYSDDDGATWSGASEPTCLRDTPWAWASSEGMRIRAFYLNNRVGLLVWRQDGSTDYLYQLVSDDDGCTFAAVETTASTLQACPDVAVRDGVAYIAHVEYNSALTNSDYVPYLRKLTSASSLLSSSEKVLAVSTSEAIEWGVYGGGRFTSAELALLVDDDGILWLYGQDYDAASFYEVVISRSGDSGTTWDRAWMALLASSIGAVIQYTGDASTNMKDLCVAPERGRAVLFHSHRANPGTADDSLSAAYLGGWTTIAMPEDESYPYGRGVAGWELVWLPFDEPDNTAATWTRNIVGAPTSVLGSGGITLTTAGGESLNYTANPALGATYPDNGILALYQLTVTSGSAIVQARISEGTNCYEVRVTVTTTTLVLRDVNAGSDLATATDAAGATGVQVLIALDHPSGAWTDSTGRVRAWYRATTTAGVGGPKVDREWTSIGTSSTLVDAVVATSRVLWGEATSSVVVFRMVAYTYGQAVAGGDPGDDPSRGRAFCSPASPAHIVGGLRLHAIDGPTVSGDTWILPAAHDYPVEAIDPSQSPSPRVRWRSTAVTQTDITFTDIDLGWTAGELIGVYLQGCNWRTGSFWRDTSATNKVMDIDLALGTGLDYGRTRDQVSQSGATGSDLTSYLHENVMVGGSFSSSAGTVVRKIAGNVSGSWLDQLAATEYRRARLRLESYDVGDPSSSNDGAIWSPTGLFISTLLQSTNNAMLRIDAQTTADGYFEIGVCVIGRIRILPRQYGHGRELEWIPSYEISGGVGGSRRVRRLAPQRRRHTVSWPSNDLTGLYFSNGNAPNYQTWGYASAPAIATRADTPSMLAGITHETGGAALPVVFAPAIPQIASAPTTSTPTRIVNPANLLYGRITGSIKQVTIPTQGNEYSEPGEVVSVDGLVIEEEL